MITWNSFGRFALRQLETEPDSLRNFRTELPVLRHLHVPVRDPLLHKSNIARLRVPSPIPLEGWGNDVRFEVSDSKAPEAVESLLLDSKFL